MSAQAGGRDCKGTREESVPSRHLARRKWPHTSVPIRSPACPSRRNRAGLDHRVARGRDEAHGLLARTHPGAAQHQADGPHSQATVAHRARLSRPEGGVGTRSLRGPYLARMEASRDLGALLLRLRDRRAASLFFPHDPRGALGRSARACGLSATSPTPSSPSALPSPELSFDGCPDALGAAASGLTIMYLDNIQD